MNTYYITKSYLSGSINIPSSKSQSIRAILFASLASNKSTIVDYLESPDIFNMITACQKLGAEIQLLDNKLIINGVNGKITTPDDVIDAGNSGQVLRFIACLAGLQQHYMVISGDSSIRHNRPIKPLIEALPKLGVSCESLRGDGFAPIILKGPFKKQTTSLNGEDSQPVSGLLMAAVFAPGVTEIEVINPGEKPWIDLTLTWLDKFNIPYKNKNYQYYQVSGDAKIDGFNYTVPGDLSSLSFPLVAALITKSSLVINKVCMQEPQGDKAIVKVLQSMGANLIVDEKSQSLTINPTAELHGIEIDINDFVDCIAILAVVGCYASGTTKITGAAIAREKESDRISAITEELRKMGANIEELADGMIIQQSDLKGAVVESYHDHRIAMSLAVAGMIAEGETVINNTECVDKSYPNFAKSMQEIGVNIENKESP